MIGSNDAISTNRRVRKGDTEDLFKSVYSVVERYITQRRKVYVSILLFGLVLKLWLQRRHLKRNARSKSCTTIITTGISEKVVFYYSDTQ